LNPMGVSVVILLGAGVVVLGVIALIFFWRSE
jgi:hypothetical protein